MAKGWFGEPRRHSEAALKGKRGHSAPLERVVEVSEMSEDRRPVRYRVRLRSGLVRDFVTKAEAMAAYRAEIRDGWPSSVERLW